MNRITALDFSPDGNYLISGSADELVRRWNLMIGEQIEQFQSSRQKTWQVKDVSFTGDGKAIAVTAVGDKRRTKAARNDPYGWAGVMDQTQAFARVHPYFRRVDGVENIYAVDRQSQDLFDGVGQIVRLPDSRVAIVGVDRVRIFDAESGICKRQLEAGDLTAAAATPDGSLIFTGNGEGEVLSWNVAGRSQASEAFEDAASSGVRALAVSADGEWLAAATGANEIRMYDILNRALSFSWRSEFACSSLAFLTGKNYLLSFSKDGENAGLLQCWTTSKKPPIRWIPDDGVLTAFAVSSDGKTLAAGCDDGKIRILPLDKILP